MISRSIKFGLIGITLLTVTSILLAGNQARAEDKVTFESFPQRGVLASSGNLANINLAIPQLPMGMTGQAVPLLGALSSSADGKWSFRLDNKADHTIKATVEIAEYSAVVGKISSRSFNFTIKPGAQAGEQISASSKAAGCAAILRGWRWAK